MTYVVLCGRPPFWGSVANHLKKMKAETFPLNKPPWTTTISADAIDFVKCLLRANPVDRLPIDRVMEHPWLRNSRRANMVADEAIAPVLCSLKNSVKNSKFLSVVLASSAKQLDCSSLHDIQ